MTDQPEPPAPSRSVSPEMGSHNLLRVVPVGQQQQVGDISLLIYSLELYDSGFVAVVRLSWIGESGALPRLTWTATDDRGTEYAHFGCGGSGGGRLPDHFSWRFGCTFGMPVPDDATRLNMTATRLGFQTVTVDDRQEPRLERGSTVDGSWRFSISLGDPASA